jgi:hypothetical protein
MSIHHQLRVLINCAIAPGIFSFERLMDSVGHIFATVSHFFGCVREQRIARFSRRTRRLVDPLRDYLECLRFSDSAKGIKRYQNRLRNDTLNTIHRR